MSDRDELIKALKRIKELATSERVNDDIYCFGGYGQLVGEALDEIDDLVHAQLAKLETKDEQ